MMLKLNRPKQELTSKPLGIYIHIPFCDSKCYYCDFYSFHPKNEEAVNRYVNALVTHMESYKLSARSYLVDTVYIGGGTPTLLNEDQLTKLIGAVKKTFRLSKNAEITIEANPATADYKKIKKLKRLGVNRLSIGLQSANDNELKLLGRRHTAEDFKLMVSDARKAGFKNISADIMFGIPDQTNESFARTLNFLLDCNVDHISMYDLKIEPNTVFGKKQKELRFPSDDTEADMYLNGIAFLEQYGYNQYEISNLAKKGHMSRHNLKYWNLEEYLGFGPAAHSYYNGVRFSFERNAAKYIESIENPDKNISITDENEDISSRERMGEYIMLRLRLKEGINERDFFYKFGKEFMKIYGKKLDRYIKGGFATYKNRQFALTPKGMFVSNYILTDILDFDNNGKFIFVGD